MHIKQVIIDGFKSYANRTVVSEFDSQFNAITGLNGSGKSNILDAICFVLGITQLSQVRVANLQGLVYKQGQSGVTKASVTIVFDNKDAKGSPVGYEQFKEITVTRQVVIGGRNKYLINGHNAQAAQVQNLFHSVQLNVNNPHFLIMQGRITKVLNMKPPEILGMIEEAAGTRMYETKKAAAEKKMDQKQIKVDEIEKILGEEITPKLQKLRSEKQSYLKWAAQNTEVERLQRFVVAYKYSECDKTVAEGESREKKLVQELESLKQSIKQGKRELESIRAEERQIEGSIMSSLSKEIEGLQKEEEIISKELVQRSSEFKNRQEAHSKYIAKKNQLSSDKLALGVRQAELEKKRTELEETLCAASVALEEAKKHQEMAQLTLHAANSGMIGSGDEKGQKTLQEELVDLESSINENDTIVKTNTLKAKHTEKEIIKVKKQVDTTSNKDAAVKKELDEQSSKVAVLEKKKPEGNYNPERVQFLRNQIQTEEETLVNAQNTVDKLSSTLAAFDFTFDKPSASFDSSKVKGMVAKLVQVQDISTASALEVVAGGKLYQVVVDSVETGKKLLDKGKLKRRVTIIPLDKISSRKLEQKKLDAASKIAANVGGSAKLALSLVGYSDEVSKAMEYVFGTTLVCDSLSTARSVTFNKEVRVKSVTLDGDAFDPQGTLSGGSSPNTGAVLLQLQKLKESQDFVAQLENTIKAATEELKSLETQSKDFQTYSQKLELARHELSLISERANSTPYAQLCQKLMDLETTLVSLESGVRNAKESKSTASQRFEDLKTQMGDMNAARDNMVKSAKAALKETKSAVALSEKLYVAAKNEAEAVVLEIENNLQDQESLEDMFESSQSQTSNDQMELASLNNLVEECVERYEQAKERTSIKKYELETCTEQLKLVSNLINDETKSVQASELKLKKVEGDLNLFEKNFQDAKKELKSLMASHPWIAAEKEYFGKPHTDYDFTIHSPEEAIEKLTDCQESQSKLSRNINKKVMGMIGKAEEEYDDLNRKRAIIEKDRETIERVIQELDTKKNEALKSTWEKVNKDFGSIFSTLLPGTQAKLDPTEGGNILEGLEVKVAFGSTWKKSLTELSGGQRSLLALSLILSLLLFKPAPMYILDEVDAALDLSHTQNIGQMLRTHFAHSQFIVVSLKEGMFNNANVLFRTKFIDGVSTVTRTECKERKAISTKEINANKKRIRKDQNMALN